MARGLKETEDFRQLMLRTLNKPKNSKKGGWKDINWHTLVHLLKLEVWELYEACHAYEQYKSKDRGSRVVEEAIDVACFAMFVADKYGGLDNVEKIYGNAHIEPDISIQWTDES